MDEYISRETAVEKITFLCELREILCVPDDEFLRGLKNALDAIKSNEFIPATDVQPVQHGRWIAENRDNRGYADCYTCTNCNCYSYTYTLMKDCEYEYCPNCGARMDGDAE